MKPAISYSSRHTWLSRMNPVEKIEHYKIMREFWESVKANTKNWLREAKHQIGWYNHHIRRYESEDS
jgi:hypothetical protein